MPKAKKTTTKPPPRNSRQKPVGTDKPKKSTKGRKIPVFHPVISKWPGSTGSKQIYITKDDILADVGNKIKEKLPGAVKSSPLLAIFSTDDEALYTGELDELVISNIKSVMVVPNDILKHYPETFSRIMLWEWTINISIYGLLLGEIRHLASLDRTEEVDMSYLLRL